MITNSEKINLLVIGKNSILCQIFLDNTKIKHFSTYSRKDLKKINFKIYTHVINFSFNPILKKNKYKKKFDFDSKLSKIVKSYSMIYIMISTRLVYSDIKKKLSERIRIYKPVTNYGKNKLIIEKNIKKKNPFKYLILRVSNILYNNIRTKKNLFFYKVLNSLRNNNQILLNFNSSTFKDFITPQYFANCLDYLIITQSIGTFNLCSGLRINVMDLVKKIIKGYGKGEVICTDKEQNNESFLMCNKKLKKKTNILLSSEQINKYAVRMGRSIKNG
jgi:dTDP-4-dehydrorhamnose reductase